MSEDTQKQGRKRGSKLNFVEKHKQEFFESILHHHAHLPDHGTVCASWKLVRNDLMKIGGSVVPEERSLCSSLQEYIDDYRKESVQKTGNPVESSDIC